VSRCTPRALRLGASIRAGADQQPDAAQAMRDLLRGRLGLASGLRFRIQHETEFLPWVLPRHRRSLHVFLCHYLEAVKERPAKPT